MCSVMVVVIARSVDNQGVWSTLSGQTKETIKIAFTASPQIFKQIKKKDLLGRSQIKWLTGANLVYMRTDVLSKLAVHYEHSAQCYCFKANIIISSNSDYFSPKYSWKSCRFRGKKKKEAPTCSLSNVVKKDIYILIHIIYAYIYIYIIS